MSRNNQFYATQHGATPPELTVSEKKPYKVVLESMTQEKKKLRSTVSYSLHAPSGYTFVPVGAPDLTEYCKELSRKRGLRVFIASDEPKSKAHKNPNNISHHIHRIGNHFRNDIVDVACELLGYTSRGLNYIRSNKETAAGPLAIARRLDSHAKRLGVSGHDASPGREREKVAGAIKDLFPKIPAEDKEAIVARAFEEGTSRVGNADLPLARRVQLAVVAHIRHTKTDYDNLLKSTNWPTARQRVEQACLEQVVKWRGEDDSGEEELEDIFQEVIVLDDETDSASSRSRDSSVEFISAHTFDKSSGARPRRKGKSAQPQAFGLSQEEEFEIVEMQPRKAPQLQQKFRERWNEARSRVGFANHSGDRGRVARITPAGSNRNEQRGGGESKVYPSVEISDQSRADLSFRTPTGHVASFRSLPDREPFALFEIPANSHEFELDHPYLVPQVGGEHPRRPQPHGATGNPTAVEPYSHPSLIYHDVSGARDLPFHGVKRKSLPEASARFHQSDQMHLSAPGKRTRLSDGSTSVMIPTRMGDATWQQIQYDPALRAQRDSGSGFHDINTPHGDHVGHPPQPPRNFQTQHPRQMEYLPATETRQGPRRTQVVNENADPNRQQRPQPIPSVESNLERLRLAEVPSASPSYARAGKLPRNQQQKQPPATQTNPHGHYPGPTQHSARKSDGPYANQKKRGPHITYEVSSNTHSIPQFQQVPPPPPPLPPPPGTTQYDPRYQYAPGMQYAPGKEYAPGTDPSPSAHRANRWM